MNRYSIPRGTCRALKPLQILALTWLTGTFLLPSLAATEYGDITAVAARASNDYVRTKLGDGSYPEETYAFGRGGVWGAALHDDSIDKLKFIDLAHTLAVSLAENNYRVSKDPEKTRLLIMVYWGMTSGSNDDPLLGHPATLNGRLGLNPLRNRADLENARLLGYDQDIIGADFGQGPFLSPGTFKARDLFEEIGNNRYFVALLAYDFQLMWKEKKTKLLWETRYSIKQRGNDFDKELAPMTQYASRYFGQDSHGLIRRRLPIESIKINETQFIGFNPEETSLSPDRDKAAEDLIPVRNSPVNSPSSLTQRLADYQREKDLLQDSLAAKIKSQPNGADSHKTIDLFNSENAAQIARLKKERENLRTELAQLATDEPASTGGKDSMDSFLGALASDLRDTLPPSTDRKP